MRRRIGAALGIVAVVCAVVVITSNRDPGESPVSESDAVAGHANVSQPKPSALSSRSGIAGGSARARSHAEPSPVESEPPAPSVVPDDREPELAREREAMKRVGPHMFEVMDELIREKAREPIIGSPPTAGSLAMGRNWCNKEMVKLLWDRVSHDLELSADQLKFGWESRAKGDARTASYGTGSFIVVKRQQTPSPSTAVDSDAEERWWAASGADEKAAWLTALFVETSGYVEVLKITTDPCPACGATESVTSDSEPAPQRCAACNGAVVVKSVVYR